MSLIGTGAQGGRPHPNWALGDLPNLLTHYDKKQITSDSDLAQFISDADADLLYGSKILLAIDAARAQASVNGVNRDMLEDIELKTGSLIPVGESTRKCMTSNFSRTGQRETLVALESSSKYGKVALLLMLLATVLKIVGWLVKNGKAFSGPGSDGGAEYASKVAEKDASGLPEGNVAGKLKMSLIKDIYIDIDISKLQAQAMERYNAMVLYLDSVFASANAEEYLNALAAASNSKPLKEVLENCAEGKFKSDNEILVAAVADLLGRRVTASIYSRAASQKAWSMMPKEFQQAGVLIPTDLIFMNYRDGITALSDSIRDMKQAFHALSSIDPERMAKGSGNVVTISGNRYNDVVDQPAREFADSTRRLINDVMMPCMSVVKDRSTFAHDKGIINPLIIIPPAMSNDLCGYTEGLTFEQGNALYVASASSFFGLDSFEAMKGKGFNLGGDSAVSLITTIVNLGQSAMTTSTRVTDLSAYNKLETELESLRKEVETFGNRVKDQSSEALKELNVAISREIKREVGGVRGDPLAVTNLMFQEDQDFYQSVSFVMNMTKLVCRAGAALQGIIERSANNPLKKK